MAATTEAAVTHSNRPSTAACYPIGSRNCGGSIKATPNPIARGSLLTVLVGGFAKSTPVRFVICNIKTETIRSNTSGAAEVKVTVPGTHAPGACRITASGTGDRTHLTVSTTANIRVRSFTAFRRSVASITYGKETSELLSVAVTPKYANRYPTGTVAVHVNASRTICRITLSSKTGAGSCRLTAKELAVGTYNLYAVYGGSTVFLSSASSRQKVVVKKAPAKKKTTKKKHHKTKK